MIELVLLKKYIDDSMKGYKRDSEDRDNIKLP